MKVYPLSRSVEITSNIRRAIKDYRKFRNFNTEQYIQKKCQLINEYFKKANLKSAVVAVSGGIDSAIVLSLINEAQKKTDSPIKNIYALLLPSKIGVSLQEDATKKGKLLCQSMNIKPHIIEMAPIVNIIKNSLEEIIDKTGDDWATGQLVSYARTPVLYYMTSILTAHNQSGLICGTTNLDEGAYLGYVGKASDGMVDIQVISDIHKSEVYKVAEALHIPQIIIEAKPSGDMYDARYDEEVFGAPYDFVELYLFYLSLSATEKETWENFYLKHKNDKEIFNKFKNNLENLRRHNAHKYSVGSPAYHLDIKELIYFKKEKFGWGINIEE